MGRLLVALLILQSGVAISEIEEVVVTARKRVEPVHKVGLTIAVMNHDAYRELTRGTLDGLAAQLSNVQAYATNSYIQSVHVRGIGLNEFQGQYDSPVAQHVDGVYISKPWMIARRQYDIERVELLKGPQGTLFGRNTTGGSINYFTGSPANSFGSMFEFGADSHERYGVEGMINDALTPDLYGRISFLGEFGSGGPQKNLYSGREHGKPNLFDVRAQLLWETDSLTVRALVHGGIDKSEKVAWKGPGVFNADNLGFCPELFTGEVSSQPAICAKYGGLASQNGSPEGEFEPTDRFTINQNTPPVVDDQFLGGYLRLEQELGRAVMTSITAFEYYERIQLDDSQSDIFNSTSTHYYNEMKQFSQELSLVGETDEQSRYVLGIYYERDDVEQADGSDLSEQPIPGVTPPFADQFFSQFTMDVQSTALFGQLERDLSPGVTIHAGARYTSDLIEVNDAELGIGNLPQRGKKRLVTPCLSTTYPGGPIGSEACPFLGPAAPPFSDHRRDKNFSWRLGLEWEREEGQFFYASLATGYRNGGFSLPFAGPATEFESENLFAQEVGYKSLWLDRTLQVDAAFFRYDYDDVQVNVDDPVSPIVPITRNIGRQVSIGAELELEWTPSEQWFLKQNLGWLQAHFDETDRVVTTYAGVIPLQGNQPVNSPKWTYNGVARYRWSLSNARFATFGIDYRWVDDRFLEATNQVFDRASDYWVVNARVAIASSDGRQELALIGTNLTDEAYLTYINNIAFFKLDIYGERRTLGLIYSARFD